MVGREAAIDLGAGRPRLAVALLHALSAVTPLPLDLGAVHLLHVVAALELGREHHLHGREGVARRGAQIEERLLGLLGALVRRPRARAAGGRLRRERRQDERARGPSSPDTPSILSLQSSDADPAGRRAPRRNAWRSCWRRRGVSPPIQSWPAWSLTPSSSAASSWQASALPGRRSAPRVSQATARRKSRPFGARTLPCRTTRSSRWRPSAPGTTRSPETSAFGGPSASVRTPRPRPLS